MPGSDTALAVDRTYSDPERHRRRKTRVRGAERAVGGAPLRGSRPEERRVVGQTGGCRAPRGNHQPAACSPRGLRVCSVVDLKGSFLSVLFSYSYCKYCLVEGN